MNHVIALSGVSLDRRLTNISVSVSKGDCVHILGPNGAGKSSLLSVMAGVLQADAGKGSLLHQPIEQWPLAALASFRTLLAQQSEAVFAVTVEEYLSFFVVTAEFSLPDMLERTLEVKTFYAKALNQLSGGERQRVEICRALIQVWPAIEQGSAIILLDEPLQGLDIRHQYAFMALCQTLRDMGNTLVLSSHDIPLSANYANKILLLKSGRCIDFGLPETVLTAEHLEFAFDCHFSVRKRDNFLEIQASAPIVCD